MIRYLFIVLLTISGVLEAKLKVLHLSFHKGCIKEVNALAQVFDLDVDTWFIPDLPPGFFDGVSSGNVLYNIGHDRAQRIWDTHRDTFEKYDMILTSDTAPLARPFLQNHFEGKLIVWICNRFDYVDEASRDCEFPDEEYYQLFDNAKNCNNVRVIAYTSFEHYYAKSKGVDTGSLVITPCVPNIDSSTDISSIPQHIVKPETFFLPPYHNERVFMNLEKHCASLGIRTYCGRYHGAKDIADFKGIIHLPYSWSNLALFENLNVGMVYFIPSEAFFRELAAKGSYFHPSLQMLLEEDLFDLSEWYSAERKDIFVYFDSWEDLLYKTQELDYKVQSERVLKYSEEYLKTMLGRWEKVLSELQK